MKIQWTKKDIDITKSMADILYQKSDKLNKFFTEEQTITMSLVLHGGNEPWRGCQLNAIMWLNKSMIKASSIKEDYYEAVDDVMDKLAAQIKKERKKSKQLKSMRGRKAKQMIQSRMPDQETKNEDIEVFKIDSKLMYLDEALLQMDLFGYKEFFFKDDNGDAKLIKTLDNRKRVIFEL